MNRRQLIKASGLAMAGAALLPFKSFHKLSIKEAISFSIESNDNPVGFQKHGRL